MTDGVELGEGVARAKYAEAALPAVGGLSGRSIDSCQRQS